MYLQFIDSYHFIIKGANVANYLKPKGKPDNKNFKKLIYRKNAMICKQKLVPLDEANKPSKFNHKS